MDPLGDPLTTRPIQKCWEFTFEPYPSWQFRIIDYPGRQFGNGSVWTRTWPRSDSPEPLITLSAVPDEDNNLRPVTVQEDVILPLSFL